MADVTIVSRNKEAIRIIAIHPTAPITPKHTQSRDIDIKSVFEYAAHSNADGPLLPTIIIGDLNATPWSHALRIGANKAKMRRMVNGSALQQWSGTWLSNIPAIGLPIDHAYGSHELAVRGYEVGNFIGSDHFPIVFDFAIKQTAPTSNLVE